MGALSGAWSANTWKTRKVRWAALRDTRPFIWKGRCGQPMTRPMICCWDGQSKCRGWPVTANRKVVVSSKSAWAVAQAEAGYRRSC